MNSTTVTMVGYNLQEGDVIVIHKSRPASKWQYTKLRHSYAWWFKWFVKLFPVRYYEWDEKQTIKEVIETTITYSNFAS